MKDPKWIHPVGTLATIVCILSLVFSAWGFGKGFDPHDPVKVAQVVVLCVWVLVPPIWFSLEKHLRRKELETDHAFERFKYAQELASKIWLSVVTVLLVLYFGKDLVNHV